MAKAYGSMAEVLGGPQGLMQYLMLERNTYEQLALANAKAIQGLSPKLTVWNTGSQGQGSSSEGDGGLGAVRNIMQSLPPLLSTINDQTGIQPPGWFAKMPNNNAEQDMQVAPGKGNKGQGRVNGIRGGEA